MAQKLLLHGKIKKVLSITHACPLEKATRNAHQQNEQTLYPLSQCACAWFDGLLIEPFILKKLFKVASMKVSKMNFENSKPAWSFQLF